jgi:hypothetical protein
MEIPAHITILIIIIIIKITSWSWVLLQNLSVVQLLKNFPKHYWAKTLISMFTRPLHWSLPKARPPHRISLGFLLIFPAICHLGLRNGFFPSGYLTKMYMQSN